MRTTVQKVQDLLGGNFGALPNGELPDCQQFIDSATVVVDRVVAAAGVDFRLIPNTAEQELIERWLAAYFYCHLDPLYSSKNTQGAGGSFVTSSTLENEGERYKRGAIELDPSGMLNAILNRHIAGAVWLGKPVSQQIPYVNRN